MSVVLAGLNAAAQQADPTAILVYPGAADPAPGRALSFMGSSDSSALDQAITTAPEGSLIVIPAGYREVARTKSLSITRPNITIDAAPGAKITAGAPVYLLSVAASSFHLNGLVLDGGGKGGCISLTGTVDDFQWNGTHSGSGYSCQNTGPRYQGLTWNGTLANSTIDSVTFKNMQEGGIIAIHAAEYNLRIHNVTVDGTVNDNPLHFINYVADNFPCTNGMVIDGFRAINFWRIGMELQGSNWCGGNIVTNVVMSDLRPGASDCLSFSAGEEASGANPTPPGLHQLELVQHISCVDHGVWKGTAGVSGTAVTWLSGIRFKPNMMRITLGALHYEVQSVADSMHLTLKTSANNSTKVDFSYPNQLGDGIEIFGDNINLGDFSVSGDFCRGVAFGGKNANIHDGTVVGMRTGCGGGPNTGVGVDGNTGYDLSNATLTRINCVENENSCIVINGANATLRDNTCSRTPGWYPEDSRAAVQCFIVANGLQSQIRGKAQVTGNRALITGLNATLHDAINSGDSSFVIDTLPQLPPIPFTVLVDREQISVNEVVFQRYQLTQVQYRVSVQRGVNGATAASHSAAAPLLLEAVAGMTFSGFSNGVGGGETDAVWRDNVISNYTAAPFGTGFAYRGGPGDFSGQELSGNTYNHIAAGLTADSQAPVVHDNHCTGGTKDWTCENQTYQTYKSAPSPGGNGSRRYCLDCSTEDTQSTCGPNGRGAEVLTVANELLCIGKRSR